MIYFLTILFFILGMLLGVAFTLLYTSLALRRDLVVDSVSDSFHWIMQRIKEYRPDF